MIFSTILICLGSGFLMLEYSAEQLNLPIEVSDFYTVVNSKFTFVDKTELIHAIMEDKAKVLLITRPHHFGKTFALSMLQNFLANNDSRPQNDSQVDLFQGLKIEKMKFSSLHKYQYPVIYISFEGVVEPTSSGAEAKVRSIIKDLYHKHEYLLHRKKLNQEDEDYFRRILNETAVYQEVKLSVAFLSRFLHAATGKKVVLLFDAYDKPFYTGYFYDYHCQMKSLIGEMLKYSLKIHGKYIEKAVLTGKVVLTEETFLSELEDLKIHSVFNDTRYAHHYGFTEVEVDALLTKTHKMSQKMELAVAYCGYNFSGSVVYNPHSLIHSLKEGKPGSYWSDEPDLMRISKAFLMTVGMNIKGILVCLLQNNLEVGLNIEEQFSFQTLRNEENNLWTLLVHAGYLNALSQRNVDDVNFKTLKIPTLDAKNCLVNLCQAAFKNQLETIIANFTEFEKSITEVNLPKMEKFIARSLREGGRFYNFKKFNSKNIYLSYFLGLLSPLLKFYAITSKQKVGYGQYDIALAPNKKMRRKFPGMIIELQIAGNNESTDEAAERAANKVDDKQYISVFHGQNYTKFYAVGIGLSEQNVSIYGSELALMNTDPEPDDEDDEPEDLPDWNNKFVIDSFMRPPIDNQNTRFSHH
ncbi:unnamed protein product [Bemisia tabaci]|uniref:AAA-ATPase-like domain-containing protein n=1 Tax=Bemisia tabaci TaxID=7038 RepID=A0A9P0G518_BEMTA|nr:unnamed protein product [Bemisia tabaci]